MECQKDKFSLDDQSTYINGAYMSPLLKTSEEAGIRGLRRKLSPGVFTRDDFFERVDHVRRLFGSLIDSKETNRVVVIPSASYALANVACNMPQKNRKKIILLEDQFPSNYYIWKRLSKERNLEIQIINRPDTPDSTWTGKILDQINEDTLVVSMPIVHWSDGTLFDVESIGEKARNIGVTFVIDGTQSIGVLPYDQLKIQADALIVSSYKWLLGPYGIGLAYYGSAFDDGLPIEESWLNRVKSDDFQYLTDYQMEYRSGARRYEMGEAPDFIKVPMLSDSLRQLAEWGPEKMQEYCRTIVQPIISPLLRAGYTVGDQNMAYHLFGIRPPQGLNIEKIKSRIADEKISVSYRKDVIRVSPNVYNSLTETNMLKDVLVDLSRNR